MIKIFFSLPFIPPPLLIPLFDLSLGFVVVVLAFVLVVVVVARLPPRRLPPLILLVAVVVVVVVVLDPLSLKFVSEPEVIIFHKLNSEAFL